MSTGRRIVLSDDDFNDEPAAGQSALASPGATQPPAGVAPPAPNGGQSLPPVARRAPHHVGAGPQAGPRPGAPPAGPAGAALPGRRWVYDSRIGPIVAAVAGIFAAWAVTELFNVDSLMTKATSNAGGNAAAGVWVGTLGLVFAAIVFAFDRAVEGAWEEAGRRAARIAIPAFVSGFVSGFLAQVVYREMLSDVSLFDDGVSARIYLARAVGWAIFGLGVGVVFGIVDGSRRKAINGLVGGAVGGAAGGLLFEWSSRSVESEGPARLIGLLGVGIFIAVAIRTVEAARRDAWLHVLAGGMAGKEFILWHETTRIGASPDSEIFLLKDPAVAKEHARIDEQGAQRTLTAAPEATVYVNQTAVRRHVLRNGDQIQIGNTVLGYAERAAVPAPAGAY
ncbi:MAG TPA: FHA domain-containing protein [Solirubrobacteraceae bacterium]|jgi:hypothetical protein